MKASVNHIKLNVGGLDFYKELLEYLGFEFPLEFSNGFGAESDGLHIFIFKTEAGHNKETNFKDTGLNHLAFQAASREEVDEFYNEYLKPKNIPILHNPKEYSEYSQGKGYYAVFFESPDHFKLEVMYKSDLI